MGEVSLRTLGPTDDAAAVTVVTGVPRSGTSLVMQMLRAGGFPILTDQRRLPDPDNPRGYLEHEAVKATRRDASWVATAAGRAVKVIHGLVDALPEGPVYRLVLVRRPLEEVVASQRVMLARRGEAETGVPDARLVEIFDAQLRELERWVARARVGLLRLDYPSLVADPQTGASALARFVGGSLDEAAMAAMVDPTLHRQRTVEAEAQPISR